MHHRNTACLFALFAIAVVCAAPATAQEEGDLVPPPFMITAQRLPPPPTSATYRTVDAPPARTRLVLISKRGNAITDDAEWFARNRLTLPDLSADSNDAPHPSGTLPLTIPLIYTGLRMERALPGGSPNRYLLRYGATHLLKTTADSKAVYALDFSQFGSPALPLGFTLEDNSGTLYVSHAINGYAKEVQNQTGYISALQPKTGKLLWRSAPLTNNADTFVETADALVCGYGFTAEPDFLYVLDKHTGKRVQTVPLVTAAQYIVKRGNRVYVRCYNTDYVFAVK